MPATKDTRMSYGIVTFQTGKADRFAGSGDWTVNHFDTGLFNIDFDPPFDSPPAVAVTQIFNGFQDPRDCDPSNPIDPQIDCSGGNPEDNAVVIAVGPGGFRMQTGNSSGDKADRMFSFVAVGPGSQSVADENQQVDFLTLGWPGGTQIKLLYSSDEVMTYQWVQQLNADGWRWIWWKTSDMPPEQDDTLGSQTYAAGLSLRYAPVTVIAQQIYVGNAIDIDNFTSKGGNTKDNAVVSSINGDFVIAIAGDEHGAVQKRVMSIIALRG